MSPENYLLRLRYRWKVLLVVAIAIVGLVALLIGVSDTDLVTQIANEAADEAARHPRILERLGGAVTISGQPTGVVRSDGGVTRINVVVPVAGSRARGTLYATGVERDGDASLSSLAAVIGGERIEVPAKDIGR